MKHILNDFFKACKIFKEELRRFSLIFYFNHRIYNLMFAGSIDG